MRGVLAKLKILIGADTDGAKAGLQELKAESEAAGNAASEAGSKGSASFEKMGQTLEDSTSGARKFVGAISSTVGALTGLLGAGAAIIGVFSLFPKVFGDTAKAANEIELSVRGASDAVGEQIQSNARALTSQSELAEELNRLRKEEADAISEITEKYGDQSEALNKLAEQGGLVGAIFRGLGGTPFEELEAEVDKIDAIRKRYEELAEQTTRRFNIVRDAAASAGREMLRSQKEAIDLTFLDEETRIERIAEIRKRSILEAAEKAGIEADDREVRRVLATIERRKNADLSAVEQAREARQDADREAAAAEEERERKRLENIAERERREKEAADRIAKAAAASFQRELSGVADSLNGTFGNNLTTKLDEIIVELREVSNVAGRR